MFKNVGNKIKIVSVLLLIAGILLSAYIGIFGHMLSGGDFSSDVDDLIMGVVIIVAGIIASVVLSLIVNGFGVIVENIEKLENINDLVLEIKNKQSDMRGDRKSASILNSSFNNEVFDDREFSSEEPAAPEYVKPVSGHEVAASKYVAPTYTGHGSERTTRPVFGTQNVGVESIKNPVAEEMPVSRPVTRPVAPQEAPVSRPMPLRQTPIESAFDEPDFDEPVQQPVQQPVRRVAPQQSAPAAKPAAPVSRPAASQAAPVSRPAASQAAPVSRPAAPQEAPVSRPVPQEAPVSRPVPQQSTPAPQTAPMPKPAFRNDPPITSAFDEPIFDTSDEPGVYESPEIPAPKVLTPEEQARANQIQELIFKFVARRNGNVNINDILRTVPRNVEPSEFQDAVKALELQGKLVKNEAGDFTAIK